MATPPVSYLGEGSCTQGTAPLWDYRCNCLYWAEGQNGVLQALDWQTGKRQTWDFPHPIKAATLAEANTLVLASDDHLYLFEPETGLETRLTSLSFLLPSTTIMDAKAGPDGTLWIGTGSLQPAPHKLGSLFRISGTGQRRSDICKITNDIAMSSGLAWSGDGHSFFHADPETGWIDRWSCDPLTGESFGRQRLLTLSPAEQAPMGGVVDISGTYWTLTRSARNTGALNRVPPSGELQQIMPLPTSTPTMMAFCGPHLSYLAITSAEPMIRGQLLLVALPVCGSKGFTFRPSLAATQPRPLIDLREPDTRQHQVELFVYSSPHAPGPEHAAITEFPAPN